MSNIFNESFFEKLGEKKEEIIEKAMLSISPEELLTIAKEYGLDIDISQASEIFAEMNQESMELSDDELDMVAGGKGGGGHDHDVKKCPSCGSKGIYKVFERNYVDVLECGECKTRFYKKLLKYR